LRKVGGKGKKRGVLEGVGGGGGGGGKKRRSVEVLHCSVRSIPQEGRRKGGKRGHEKKGPINPGVVEEKGGSPTKSPWYKVPDS